MNDHTFAYFTKNAIAHGVAENSPQIYHIEVTPLGDLFERSFSTDWYGRRQLKMIDSMETDQVIGLEWDWLS